MKGKLFRSMVTFALYLLLFLHSPADADIRTLSIEMEPVVATSKESSGLSKIITKRNVLDQEEASTARVDDILNSAEHQVSTDRSNGDTSENDRFVHLLHLRYRERRKQQRLMAIQAHIIQNLRIKHRPNISSNVFSEEEQRRMNDLVQRVHHINNNNNNDNSNENEKTHDNGYHQTVRSSRHRPVNSENPFSADNSETKVSSHPQTTMQWLQSFYPSCVLQNQMDRGIWEHNGTFRVYYDLPLKRYTQGSKVTVLLAKLRLYKTTNTWDSSKNNLHQNAMDDDVEISVSIYQLLRPLRVNRRERKRLIETQLLSIDEEGWFEFDVVPTLNFWLHHPHRNYGFEVQVEDNQGNKMDPNIFFRSMDCIGETEIQESPFPNIRGIHPEIVGENESSLFEKETYPMLDLQMASAFTKFDSLAFENFMGMSTSGTSRRSTNSRRNGAGQERVLTKRHLFDHPSNPDICQKETVYVTFDELGLGDVVLAPEGFSWTVCSSNSSIPFDDISSNKPHSLSFMSHISTAWRLLMMKYGHRKELYCVETEWKPLRVMYFDDELTIQNQVVEKFLPTSCACRFC